jgi:site-specific DNA recombinase
MPALLKGLIFGPNGRPMSPSHTRRRGRIYRYYVTREAIADGYDSCAVTSVPAADVERAVLDHVQKLLAAPELVARTWAAAKRNGEDEITEREVTVLLADFAPPSRRGSCSSWSSGSTCRRTRSRCGSGPSGWQA